MKHVDEQDFVVPQTPVIPLPKSIRSAASICLAVIRRMIPERHTLQMLPRRLRRDAGVDEDFVEQRRVARAPLIR